MPTEIEWTQGDDGTPGETWNPISGCSPVSPGCDGCYAINQAHRMSCNPNLKISAAYEGVVEDGHWTGRVNLLPDRLNKPLTWRKPRRVFVNSMSDLFHPNVPTRYIGTVWAVMTAAERHTFQVLTKRPARASMVLSTWEQQTSRSAYGGPSWLDDRLRWNESRQWPVPNVWMGTSIESNRYVFRADHLRATPAAVRFLSLEPLLGPLPDLDLAGIDWVIVGGESGPGARPMHPDWARSIRDRCVHLGIPFFFKQRGAWTWDESDDERLQRGTKLINADGVFIDRHEDGDEHVWRVGKHRSGHLLDGREWRQFPVVKLV